MNVFLERLHVDTRMLGDALELIFGCLHIISCINRLFMYSYEYVSIKNNLTIGETGMLAPATCSNIILLFYDCIRPKQHSFAASRNPIRFINPF